ncbi:NlpC/P60 family protein [Glutamicibacter sp. V16R2B1]|uniref:NlpC/P60 family protein n=1 Tax=Glutamicibacter sp. V16R2B1 TaxID=2036207 RepID=UPI0024B558B7|nr:NlpC/P60 family protein [Glutamicibacter sp. V16R2B1]
MSRLTARAAAVILAVAAAVGLLLPGAARADGQNPLAPVLQFMHDQLGKPYVWAANGPDAWDCSSLVQAAYRTIGATIPRITTQQVNAGQRIDRKDLQPGDLLFTEGPPPQPGHVGMYVGNNTIIEAKGTKYGVVETPLDKWTNILAIVRPNREHTIGELITEAAAKEGLPRALLDAQINQESGYNPRAGSAAGAQGIAQFMPGTWASSGVDGDGDGDKDIWDPVDAIPAMAKHMAALIRANDGDVGRALAGYNAGQGAVQKYNGIPPYRETQNYVRSIQAASGVSGRIELHPQELPPPPLPQRIVEETVDQVVAAVTLPPPPSNPVELAHDIAVGLLVVGLAAAVLRRFAPHLRSAVRRASARPPRPAGGPTARYVARAATAAATRGVVRQVYAARQMRRGTAYQPTRLVSSAPHRTAAGGPRWATHRNPRRMPQGWTPPQRPRTAPSPTARGGGRDRTAPQGRTAMRWSLRWPHLRLRWPRLRWPHRNTAPQSAAPTAAGTASTATGTASQPPQAPQHRTATTATTAPQSGTATAPAGTAPQPRGGAATATLIRPAPQPVRTAPQGGKVMSRFALRKRAPIQINPLEYLPSSAAHALNFAAQLPHINWSDGPTIVALAVYLDNLATSLADGSDWAADEISRRAFHPAVVAELRRAVESMGWAADHFRGVAWILRAEHRDLFELRASTPETPISFGSAA